MSGEEVKKIREQWGMSQKEFAIAIGQANVTTISRWETGKVAVPTLDEKLIRILEKRRKKNSE